MSVAPLFSVVCVDSHTSSYQKKALVAAAPWLAATPCTVTEAPVLDVPGAVTEVTWRSASDWPMVIGIGADVSLAVLVSYTGRGSVPLGETLVTTNSL